MEIIPLPKNHFSHPHAFTLLELLIVLAVCSILILSSAHGAFGFITRHIAQSDLTRFFHTLAFARAAAIQCNCTVTVCPTDDDLHCSTHWGKRYIALKNDTVILHNAVHTQTHIESGDLHTIRFQGDGRCKERGTLSFRTQASVPVQAVLVDSTRARMVAAHNIPLTQDDYTQR